VVLPILVGSLCTLDFLVCLEFVLMELEIPASDYIVVSETSGGHFLYLLFLFFLGDRSLLWCGKMMLCQRYI
jgi:hypothetical protein